MTHPLDADTALDQVTPTRWRGEITGRWWVVRGPFGGYVATFLTRAMMTVVDDPARRPRSLTVHYIEAPKAGPVDVSATIERTGRSATSVSLRLEQDGAPVALALGSCAAWRDGEPEWTEAAPDARVPAAYGRLSRADPMPGFLDRLEIRPVYPIFGGKPRNLAWLRFDPPRPLDHVALTALSDGWMPAAFSKLHRPFGAPTVDLTIHFRAPVPSGEWVLADYRSRFSAGGVWEEDGELWAEDGTLLAQSRQLALIQT